MKVYEVRQFSNYPQRLPGVDKLIKEFEYEKEAVEFAYEYNSQKMKDINGNTAYFPVKKRTFKGKLTDYKYIHNGNDSYYVEKVIPAPKHKWF